jgi:pimeloyl-ACP methyl ester carboxylesterase
VPATRVGSFRGRDGTELAFCEVGEGRTLVLLHGFFATGTVHWIDPGHAALLAERGYRVVLPDLRGHGSSERPADPAAYPPDVLVDDGLALLDHLGVEEFDLGGYSLGGRTALRMLVRGARPGRAVIAGMGLDPILEPAGRGDRYRHVLGNLGSFEEGTLEWRAEQFLRSVDGDPEALLQVLDCSVPTPAAAIAAVPTPTLVLLGDGDEVHRSAPELAALLPNGTFAGVPGSHTRAIRQPELGAAIVDFLGPAAAVGELT